MNFIEFIKFEWSSGNWFQRAMMVAMGVLITFMLVFVSALLIVLFASLTAKTLFGVALGGGFICFLFTWLEYEQWKYDQYRTSKYYGKE